MGVNSGISDAADYVSRAAASPPDKTPLIGGLVLGLVGSLCCGGGLIFGAIGLGAFYGALGIARYIPEALGGGALLILLLNWLYYRRKAARILAGGADCDCGSLRHTALLSTFVGLVVMAAGFIFLEWLNHGVVRAAHFVHNPEFATAMIPGVPNVHVGYVALTFLALPVLAMLPLPQKSRARHRLMERLSSWQAHAGR
jgi:hypothetical protein